MLKVIEFLKDEKELLLSIVIAITSIFAIIQTQRQIKLSNKQLLFDRRLKKYLFALDLFNLYKNSIGIFDYKTDSFNESLMYDTQFLILTNIENLKDIYGLMDNYRDNELRVNFLTKIDELKKVSLELKIIFSKKEGQYLSDFIYAYQETLMQIYKYSIFNQILEKTSKVDHSNTKSSEEINRQENILFEKFENLHDSYKRIIDNDIINKVEKRIKL